MKAQTNRKPQIKEESIEAKLGVTSEFKNIGKGILKSASNDLLRDSGKNLWDQLLGGNETPNRRDEAVLSEGEEIKLKNEKVAVSAEFVEYKREVINGDKKSENAETYIIREQIEQIRLEIRKLVKSSKVVEQTVKDATSEHAPVKPGKYHVSFFEFVLGVIKDATRKLEDASSMGAMFTNKKQQRQYWNMYKKHGTTFGLSGERTTATQTG